MKNSFVFLFSLAIFANCANADEDQQSFGPLAATAGIGNNLYVGQSFTAGLTGQLTQIDVNLVASGYSTGFVDMFVIPLADASTFNRNNYTSFVSVDSSKLPPYSYAVPTFANLIQFDITSLNINVVAGQQYAFVFEARYDQPDGDFADLSSVCINCGQPDQTGPYAGGYQFAGGPGFYEQILFDTNFVTWVGSAPPITNPALVPEPETFALLMSGLFLLASRFRKVNLARSLIRRVSA